GLGTGAFQAPVNFSVGAFPRSVEVGDFDGDGKLDLVTANSTDNISVLLNNGNDVGGNPTFQAVRLTSLSGPAEGIAVGDLNADGKLDLVTANGNGNSINVLLN